MTNFIVNGFYSILNSFRRLWPNESLKRCRDSDEEDDDVLVGCQTLSKRPKWTIKQKMAANNDSENGSSHRRSYSLQKVQRNTVKRLKNVATKENGNDVEVVEIEDDDHHIPESRPPLTDLSVKPKTYVLNGMRATRQPDQKCPERRKNGVQPLVFQNSFTTPMKFSKYSSVCHRTALNETLKADDQRCYSELLARHHRLVQAARAQPQDLKPFGEEARHHRSVQAAKAQPQDLKLFGEESRHHRSVQAAKPQPQDLKPSGDDWSLESSVRTMGPSVTKSRDRPVSRVEIKKTTRLPVKPWHQSESEDVVIIEEKSTPRVNSLEKKLSQNEVISPEWIIEMKKKYSEREREAKRQLEEAQIKKELYAKHNQSRTEALDERIKKHLQLTDVVLEDVDDGTKLPELTETMNIKIDSAFRPNPPSEVLVEGFGHLIKRHDIKTLHNLNWLNDEVINFYMNLIVERGKEGKYPKVFAFNTFFYPKLVSHGYSTLRRWTKKVDIFDHDLLLVPIHLGMHWCMAAINLRECWVRYYDSMGSDNNRCLNALLNYLNEESLDKKKKPFDTTSWKTENVKGIPQQMNGSDCGMFSCMFAEYLSRNAKFTFSQNDMPYFRRKMVYEIICKQLLL